MLTITSFSLVSRMQRRVSHFHDIFVSANRYYLHTFLKGLHVKRYLTFLLLFQEFQRHHKKFRKTQVSSFATARRQR